MSDKIYVKRSCEVFIIMLEDEYFSNLSNIHTNANYKRITTYLRVFLYYIIIFVFKIQIFKKLI